VSDPGAFGTGAEVCLVRHAESEWNATGRWQGQSDPPLSLEGRRQVARLAERLVAEFERTPVSGLVCSDLARARATAAGVAEVLGLDARLEPGLREMDIGEWSGLTREEIAGLAPTLLTRFDAGDPDARPPGGETRREIRHRARLALRRIVNADPSGRIIVVTHLGVIRALLPGAETGNAEFQRVSAADALTRRLREEHADGEEGPELL